MKNPISQAIFEKCDEVSQVLKSLAHPVRVKVFCQLMEGEKSVNELTAFCKISQSAMSQFLGRMRDEQMIDSRKEGTQVFYRIVDSKLTRLFKSIKDIYC